MTFAKEFAAARPAEVALRDPEKHFTWGQVDEILNRVANGLQAIDLGPEHRVAVFAENAAETALSHIGALIAGASAVPVNFHLTADEVNYILNDSMSYVLFVDRNTIDRGIEAAASSSVHTIVAWGVEPRGGTVAWSDWLAGNSPEEPDRSVEPRPNLMYTSGTTGRPKGTDLPPTMFAGGETVEEHLAVFRERVRESQGDDPRPQLIVGPMYHTGPLSGTRQLLGGLPSVILGRFDAEKTLAAIQENRVQSLMMVPTHFARLLALPDEVKRKYDVSSLKTVAHTGSKCPVDIKRAMIDWFGPILMDAYGASEVGTTCRINSEEWLAHPGSVGKAIPPFTALILDDDGNELPPNTEGRLYFKDATGRGVVYYNDPEKSAAAHIAPGVFTLGEIAYMDEEGYVYITDRFSDMIVSGGVNIYPAEAEHVLIEHPAVLDVACIGVPNKEMGEELKALVIPRKGGSLPSPKELIDWCRERLSHYKCPRTLDYVDDIGRNTMGKINKRRLRAPYWEGVSS